MWVPLGKTASWVASFLQWESRTNLSVHMLRHKWLVETEQNSLPSNGYIRYIAITATQSEHHKAYIPTHTHTQPEAQHTAPHTMHSQRLIKHRRAILELLELFIRDVSVTTHAERFFTSLGED